MSMFVGVMRGRRLGRWWLVALALAASAVLIQRKSRAVEADYPPLGTFLEVDGVRLHVLVRGKGEPLLLLHGNGSNVLDLELSGLLELVFSQTALHELGADVDVLHTATRCHHFTKAGVVVAVCARKQNVRDTSKPLATDL